jgi:hypothetical protein
MRFAIRRSELRVSRPSASRSGGAPATVAAVAAAVAIALVGVVGLARARMDPGEVQVSLPVYHPTHDLERFAESWHYRFTWNGIPVGSVTMSAATGGRVASERVLEVGLRGRTNDFVDYLWRYRLDARGTIRLDPFSPSEFVSEESEQGKAKLTEIRFDDSRQVRTFRKKGDRVTEHEFAAPNTHDMFSAVFLFLNLDFVVGQEFRIDALTGTARYLVTVRVEGRDEIVAAGRKTGAYRLWVETSELTDPDGDEANHRGTHIWVSDDRPRRLLRARSRTFVGSIYLELESVQQESEPAGDAPADGGMRGREATTPAG